MNDRSASNVIETISPRDEMFQNNLDHYFRVGCSAIQNILLAIRLNGCTTLNSILDLPCGHGRVLRHIRAQFPDAALTACDLNRDGVDFCANTFGAIPAYSTPELRELKLKSRFDLIWCGSLFTHFDKTRCFDLLDFLSEHLLPDVSLFLRRMAG